ncbi:hypothetical protein LT493_23130 [Streptomyces tricolor]|nr:hypothetical protein [Streptomyces tricolor]
MWGALAPHRRDRPRRRRDAEAARGQRLPTSPDPEFVLSRQDLSTEAERARSSDSLVRKRGCPASRAWRCSPWGSACGTRRRAQQIDDFQALGGVLEGRAKAHVDSHCKR